MKGTIWKFPLKTVDEQTIEMPFEAQILSLKVQDGEPCIWAFVDPSKPKVERKFDIFGTGHQIAYDTHTVVNHIGTYQLEAGALVFHVFEKLKWS